MARASETGGKLPNSMFQGLSYILQPARSVEAYSLPRRWPALHWHGDSPKAIDWGAAMVCSTGTRGGPTTAIGFALPECAYPATDLSRRLRALELFKGWR